MRPFRMVRTAAIGTAVLAALGAARVAAPPTVKIDTGSLEGLDTAGVMVFRGIPYARPPVDQLRWRPPLPTRPWRGV
jgi:para-nitrobenzyl esterase